MLSSKLGRAADFNETLSNALGAYLEKNDPVMKAQRAQKRQEEKARAKAQAQAKAMRDEADLKPADSKRSDSEQSSSERSSAEQFVTGQSTTELCTGRKMTKISLNRESSALGADADRRVSKKKKKKKKKRVPFTAAEMHAVHARDGGRCTFVDPVTGKRCQNDRWLHFHHIVGVAQGGGNNPENISSLCAAHHDLVHQMCFPLDDGDQSLGLGAQPISTAIMARENQPGV
ncbi:MAG: hypothetical protein C5B49_00015 [Bdellovibrio sp.]|nr:MAG: hypothetical protein C5B49_00015 [Bdellovibrio sp.]